MPRPRSEVKEDDRGVEGQPRGILRVPEVLLACATKPNGGSLAELAVELELPKTSLYRMLRTLERGGYLINQSGAYLPGPASYHLASRIGQTSQPINFPGCARPIAERLARESGESVVVGLLAPDKIEMIYVDAIDSVKPLRYTLPIGDRRPLFCGAAGKAVLAFQTPEEQRDYIASTDFRRLTPFTTRKEQMPDLLEQIRRDSFVYDRNGNFEGASAIASPIFDKDRRAFAAVSLAGPTDRMDAELERFTAMVRTAAERISRTMGYTDHYPPGGA